MVVAWSRFPGSGYRLQALQTVSPFGPRRHNGGVIAPQSAQTVVEASGEISLRSSSGSSNVSIVSCELDALADDIRDWWRQIPIKRVVQRENEFVLLVDYLFYVGGTQAALLRSDHTDQKWGVDGYQVLPRDQTAWRCIWESLGPFYVRYNTVNVDQGQNHSQVFRGWRPGIQGLVSKRSQWLW